MSDSTCFFLGGIINYEHFTNSLLLLFMTLLNRLKPLFSISRKYYGHPVDSLPALVLVTPLQNILAYYRAHGHNYAATDPLNLFNSTAQGIAIPKEFQTSNLAQLNGTAIGTFSKDMQKLRRNLKEVYCSKVGVQFQHIASSKEKDWLYHNFQQLMLEDVSETLQKQIFRMMVETQTFDQFLGKKFGTFKRYAGQGAQSAIIGLNALFTQLSKLGIDSAVVGVPHRGRLNFLTNLLEYPPRLLFSKIAGCKDLPQELPRFLDDVTSHVSVSSKKIFKGTQKPISISIVHNPSHLQAQNPVSMGKTRCKQDQLNSKQSTVNIQIHGDAAFAGQGVVYQSFVLSKTAGYDIGGTIHLVVNNQIGYTTYPKDSRGSKYCTDICKAFDTPILHVNGNEPQTLHKIMGLAAKYRKEFKKDILVDLICYRKYGHNEVDQPSFTQPLMYKQIKSIQSPPQAYFQRLKDKGILVQADFDKVRETANSFLQKQFQESKKIKLTLKDVSNVSFKGNRTMTDKWKAIQLTPFGKQPPATGIAIHKAKQYAKMSVQYPDTFKIHDRIKKFHVSERLKEIDGDQLGWATCQALAFFSLVDQGYGVRMTGQDIQRGTFSQRHMIFTDQETEAHHFPLKEFSRAKNKVSFYNSALIENAVVGYQYGYSLQSPENLVLWQAQFGDFYNTAQVMVDTFITNSQIKWMRQNHLVMILPHGFDGMGPEHTSARIQRFLLLADSDGWDPKNSLTSKEHSKGQHNQNYQTANFNLCYPTTPANYFHLLRRQMKRDYRKPLILAGPKILLRLKDCISSFHDLSQQTKFKPIITYQADSPKKLILTSGKFVYEIKAILKKNSIAATVLAIQQLYPFPYQAFAQSLKSIDKQADLYWVQEETMNSGSYIFVRPRVERLLKSLGIKNQLTYIGRRGLGAVAVGNSADHKKQNQQLALQLSQI